MANYGKRMVSEIDIAQIGQGGGSEYTAGKGIDITDGAISVDTTDLTATSTSSVTPATVTLTFTYSDNTTADITLMTGATVSTTTTLGTTE